MGGAARCMVCGADGRVGRGQPLLRQRPAVRAAAEQDEHGHPAHAHAGRAARPAAGALRVPEGRHRLRPATQAVHTGRPAGTGQDPASHRHGDHRTGLPLPGHLSGGVEDKLATRVQEVCREIGHDTGRRQQELLATILRAEAAGRRRTVRHIHHQLREPEEVLRAGREARCPPDDEEHHLRPPHQPLQVRSDRREPQVQVHQDAAEQVRRGHLPGKGIHP